MNMKRMKVNEALRLVRVSNRVLNKVRHNSSESPEHVLAKKTVCKALEILDLDYITESIFITGGKADIFVLEKFLVIELVKSESSASILAKRKLYPMGLKIRTIEVN